MQVQLARMLPCLRAQRTCCRKTCSTPSRLTWTSTLTCCMPAAPHLTHSRDAGAAGSHTALPASAADLSPLDVLDTFPLDMDVDSDLPAAPLPLPETLLNELEAAGGLSYGQTLFPFQ